MKTILLLLISVACFDIAGYPMATSIMTWIKTHPFWTIYILLGIGYNINKNKKGKQNATTI